MKQSEKTVQYWLCWKCGNGVLLNIPAPFGALALPATKFYCVIIQATSPQVINIDFIPNILIIPSNITVPYHAAPDISTGSRKSNPRSAGNADLYHYLVYQDRYLFETAELVSAKLSTTI